MELIGGTSAIRQDVGMKRDSSRVERQRSGNGAGEIHSIPHDFGESNPEVERFIHFCSLGDLNVPGEPRLAQVLPTELESRSGRSQ